MARFIDITSQRFGRLVAIAPTNKRSGRCILWFCRCDCDRYTYATSPDLKRKTGAKRSCGCICPKPANIKNRRFGRLVAIRPTAERDSDGNIFWYCRCDCGKSHHTPAHSLLRGLVRSCGCRQRNYKHGHTRKGKHHPLYTVWIGMRARCRDPNNPKYKYYGARGIRVTKRWEDFETFLTDVGSRPPNTTLDRYPNKNGHYAPSNVRWATIQQQRENQRPPRKRLEQFTTAELKAELTRRRR